MPLNTKRGRVATSTHKAQERAEMSRYDLNQSAAADVSRPRPAAQGSDRTGPHQRARAPEIDFTRHWRLSDVADLRDGQDLVAKDTAAFVQAWPRGGIDGRAAASMAAQQHQWPRSSSVGLAAADTSRRGGGIL